MNINPINLKLIENILKEAKLSYNTEILSNLYFYFDNLIKWNKNINLTATLTFNDAVNKHLPDTITSLAFLRGEKILDVGTGAGVPGLLIKILCPEYKLFLLDAVRKKVSFLQFIINSLKLSEITAIHGRIEKNQKNPQVSQYYPFDTIISQAVGDMQYLMEISEAYLSPTGRMILMKGKGVSEELEKYEKKLIDNGWEISINEVTAPVVGLQRFLVIMERKKT